MQECFFWGGLGFRLRVFGAWGVGFRPYGVGLRGFGFMILGLDVGSVQP